MLTNKPITPDTLLTGKPEPAAGALVIFKGLVRDNHRGVQVNFLEYSAFEPLAEHLIDLILKEAEIQYQLLQARCIHRIGRLAPGETAIVVATLARHRQQAYQANEYIMNRVKQEVPIWKKEYFDDGSSRWGEAATGAQLNQPDSISHH